MRKIRLPSNHLIAIIINPLIHWGGGALYAIPPPPPLVFCSLFKISLGNPYLKILDLAKLFVVGALLNMGLKTTHG